MVGLMDGKGSLEPMVGYSGYGTMEVYKGRKEKENEENPYYFHTFIFP